MKKNIIYIFPLLMILNTCTDRGTQEKKSPYLASYEELDEIFGWSGRVDIVDTLDIDMKAVNDFIRIAKERSKPGMVAAVKFRTAQFEEAFEIYKQIYSEGLNHGSISKDLKASLAGIMLGPSFDLTTHGDLYYKSEEIIAEVNFEILTPNKRQHLNDYLAIIRDIELIDTLIKSPSTLENLIKSYNISERELVSMYQDKIDKNEFAIAAILSVKVNQTQKNYLESKKLLNNFLLGNYFGVLNQYNKSKTFFKSIEDVRLNNLIDTIMFYTYIELKEYENLLEKYLSIERYYQYVNYQVHDNSNFEISSLNSFNILDEIKNVRNALKIQVLIENISEEDLYDQMPNINNIKKIFYELLLLKTIQGLDYDKAYYISTEMYDQLLFGELISRNSFLRLKNYIEIVYKINDRDFLVNRMAQIEENIINSIDPMLSDYGKRDEYINNNREILKSDYIEVLETSLFSNSDRYRNIIHYFSEQEDFLVDNLKRVINNRAEFAGNSMYLPLTWSYAQGILIDGLFDWRNSIAFNPVYFFLNPKSQKTYYEIHRNLLLYNLLLENLNFPYDEKFSHYYLSLYFYNKMEGIGDLTTFINSKKAYLNCSYLEEIDFISDDKELLPLEFEYYSKLKFKLSLEYNCL